MRRLLNNKMMLVCCTFLCFLFLSCNKLVDTEKMKKEIIAELKKQPVVIKGDGSHMYSEPVVIGGEEYLVQHSTLKCTNIRQGAVLKDALYPKDKFKNLFCTVCMDDRLIDNFLESNFPSKPNNK